MIISVRALNAFGNVLHQAGNFNLSANVHQQVLRLVAAKKTEVDLPEGTAQERQLCRRIKEAHRTYFNSQLSSEHTRRKRQPLKTKRKDSQNENTIITNPYNDIENP